MIPTIVINPKALQLSIIMLRQYRPAVAKLLPGPESYPATGNDIELNLSPSSVSNIIVALNELGDEWVADAKRKPNQTGRNQLRQQCLSFILDEWISVGEQCQRQLKMSIH